MQGLLTESRLRYAPAAAHAAAFVFLSKEQRTEIFHFYNNKNIKHLFLSEETSLGEVRVSRVKTKEQEFVTV